MNEPMHLLDMAGRGYASEGDAWDALRDRHWAWLQARDPKRRVESEATIAISEGSYKRWASGNPSRAMGLSRACSMPEQARHRTCHWSMCGCSCHKAA